MRYLPLCLFSQFSSKYARVYPSLTNWSLYVTFMSVFIMPLTLGLFWFCFFPSLSQAIVESCPCYQGQWLTRRLRWSARFGNWCLRTIFKSIPWLLPGLTLVRVLGLFRVNNTKGDKLYFFGRLWNKSTKQNISFTIWNTLLHTDDQ